MQKKTKNLITPQHIAIVMDGNGRWAEQRGLPHAQGHQAGVDSIRACVEVCLREQIPILTLFAFSRENWRRSLSEVNHLFKLFYTALIEFTPELMEQEIKLELIGDLTPFPKKLKDKLLQVAEQTKTHQKLHLIVALNYGGRWDIIQAANALLEVRARSASPRLIAEDEFASYLSCAHVPDPDLLIRTSGEQRISNFFLWDLAYTELYFTSTLWPDFRQEACEQALQCYATRQRRFGGRQSALTDTSDANN